MFDFFHNIFILPLELIMQLSLEWGFEQTNSYGFAIIFMSLVVSILLIPFYHVAEKWQDDERKLQASMADELDLIKRTFEKQERHMMLRTMYRQHGYSPIMAVRTSFGFLIQVPFFLAAYQFLSNYTPLQGVSFLGIADLAKPDGLLILGSLAINLLPFIMTAINILSSFVYSNKLTKRDKIQLYSIAGIFLILLYNAAAALVLYWTCNNIFSLLKNILYERCNILGCVRFPIQLLNSPKKFLKKWFPTPAMTAFFFAFLPFPILWNANINIITPLTLLGSTLVIFFMGIIAFFCGIIFDKIVNINKTTRKLYPLFLLVFCSVCVLVVWFIWKLMLNCFIYTPNEHVLYYILTTIVLSLFISLVSFHTLNKILLTILVVVTLSITGGVFLNISDTMKNFETETFNFDLKEKPNIYLYVLESYHPYSIMNTIYGMDTCAMEKFLNKNDFVSYDDVYSNGKQTLISLYRTFIMDMGNKNSMGNLDVPPSVRGVVGGNKENILFKYLKGQGYTIELFYPTPWYYMFEQGEFVDNCNLPKNTTSKDNICAFFSNTFFQGNPLSILYNRLIDKHKTGDITDTVSKIIKNIKQKEPLFFVFKGGADHSPGDHTWKKKDSWIASNHYQDLVRKSDEEVKIIVESIVKSDPNSIIILLGDHGPISLRDLDEQTPFGDMQAMKKNVTSEGYTLKDIADDRFKVMCAVRMPNGKKDITEGYPITLVNLFRHVFSAINNDLSILDTCVESWSELNGVKLVKNGVVQDW